MPRNSDWNVWLHALGDPACVLTVTHAGHLRQEQWEHGPRRLPDHMLHFVTCGAQEGLVDGRRVHTEVNDLLWVPAQTTQHVWKSPAEPILHFHYLRFTLRDAHGQLLEIPPRQPLVWHFGGPERTVMAELVGEQQHRLPAAEARTRALLVLLITACVRSGERNPGQLDMLRKTRLVHLIHANPGKRWTHASLAAQLEISALHLTRIVRATYGMPLRRWLVVERIRLAAERLREGDEPISAIAKGLGYPDIFLFSRQFHAVMGRSPTAWRAAGAGQSEPSADAKSEVSKGRSGSPANARRQRGRPQ